MYNQDQSSFIIVPISLLIALMMNMVPLPDWAVTFRPDWLTLVMIYWCMALPKRVNIGVAWGLGLLLDVAQGTLLGQHAIGMAVVAYLTAETHQRIRVFSIWQQSLVIFIFLCLKQLLVVWVDGIMGAPPQSLLYFAPSFTGMLFWPWIFVILRHFRRQALLS